MTTLKSILTFSLEEYVKVRRKAESSAVGYVRKNERTLRREYGTNYIRIRNGRVIDSDEDKKSLDDRMDYHDEILAFGNREVIK